MMRECRLRIRKRGAGGYTVQYVPGDGGKGASHTVKAGVVDAEEMARILADSGHTVAQLKDLGDRLGKAFLAGSGGEAWLKERAAALQAHREWQDRGETDEEPLLRTYLEVEPAELQIAPFELARVNGINVFVHRGLGVARLWTATPGAGRGPEWPLRILLVAGEDGGRLGTQTEARRLRYGLRDRTHHFDIEVFDCRYERELPDGVKERLKRRIRELSPQVLHFAGHAGVDPAAVQLGDAQKAGEWWTAEEMGEYLGALAAPPQLVFLNACRTAKSAAEGDSFARRVVEQGGAGALLAMSGNVAGEEAAKLAERIYRGMSEGLALDRAISVARGELGSGTAAAYYPMLTVAATPPVYRRGKALDAGRAAYLQNLGEERESQFFLDRTGPRRNLVAAMRGGTKAVAVVGDSENGKSWFLRSCLQCLSWTGMRVVYLNLQAYGTWAELLRAMANGGAHPLLGPEKVDETARRELETMLAKDLVKTGLLPEAAAKALEVVRPGPGEEPVVLMLDHLEVSDGHASVALDGENICRYLFQAVANGDGRLRMVLASSNGSILKAHAAGVGWASIELTAFPAPEVPELMREWFWVAKRDEAEAERFVLPVKKERTPLRFAQLCADLQGEIGARK
jgi:hypothetical protein